MKKILAVLSAAALLIFMLWERKDPTISPDVSKTESLPNLNPAPASAKQDIRASTRPADETWMEKTLAHQLTPEFIQSWTRNQGLELKQETKGHPKSGQRLELTWGSDPATTAVFDIMGPQQVQLSAVRSLYPQESSLSEMKTMLQDRIKRPIEREDDQSVVFTADERGLTVWLARQADGRLKVAFEYGAHSHPAEGP